MKHSTISAKYRLAIGVGALLCTTLFMGLFSYIEIRNLTHITEQMYQHPFAVSNAVRDVRADIIAMHRSMKDVALARNDLQLEKAVTLVNRLEQNIYADFKIIEERFLGDKREVEIAKRSFRNWKTIRDEVIAKQQQEKFSEAAQITRGRGADHVRTMDQDIQLMVDFANQKGIQFFEDAQKKGNYARNAVLGFGLSGIVAGLLVAYYISAIWRETEYQNTLDNWQKQGREELNIAIGGNQNLNDLSRHIIRFLAKYLKAEMGAFYLHRQKKETFALMAGYSLDNDSVPREIISGQGLAGEAIRNKKMIRISNPDELSFSSHSATGSVTMSHILAMPFTKDNRVTGLIELGSVTAFSDEQTDFLESVVGVVSSAVIFSEARTAMENLHEESRQRTTLLEKQEYELLQTSRYKSEFISNMSHELRTPLNSLLILAESLTWNKEKNLSKKQIKAVEVIHQSGQDLLKLINEILDLSKIEAGRTEILIETVKLSVFTDTIRSLFTHMAESKNLQFILHTDKELPETLETDPHRLGQILKNIIGNALKFTEKGNVTVQFKKLLNVKHCRGQSYTPDNSFAIAITDSGIGIDTEMHEAVFSPFQQEESSTTRQFGGTGLGLSISRELVHLLGGCIELESSKGEGATFTIYLPHHSPETETETETKKKTSPAEIAINSKTAPRELAMKPEAPTEHFTSLEGVRILLVDDNLRNIFSLSGVLEDEGLLVENAENGEQALLKIENEYFDIILMDMMMPVMDGYEAIKRIRAQDEYKELPIIALTAKATENDKKACYLAGATDFLAKPVNVTTLLRKLQEL